MSVTCLRPSPHADMSVNKPTSTCAVPFALRNVQLEVWHQVPSTPVLNAIATLPPATVAMSNVMFDFVLRSNGSASTTPNQSSTAASTRRLCAPSVACTVSCATEPDAGLHDGGPHPSVPVSKENSVIAAVGSGLTTT